MGKGDWRRPTQVSPAEAQRNWDEAFGKRDIPNLMPEDEREAMDREKAELDCLTRESPNE